MHYTKQICYKKHLIISPGKLDFHPYSGNKFPIYFLFEELNRTLTSKKM